MAYNIFPQTATVESPFFLMYGQDAYLLTLHHLLQPKMPYMGDEECKIHLDKMREVYMLAVLNLIISHDRYPPPMGNPCNEELKNGRFSADKESGSSVTIQCKVQTKLLIIKRYVTSHMMHKTLW